MDFVISILGQRETCHVARSTVYPAVQERGEGGCQPGKYITECGRSLDAFTWDKPSDPFCQQCLARLPAFDVKRIERSLTRAR